MSEDCQGNLTYGVCLPEQRCSYIMKVPARYRCQYAMDTADCADRDTVFEYMNFLACNFNSFEEEMYWGLLTLTLISILYFIMLSCISDCFTPSLCYVSNILGLSEPVAGATLLAFGNAAPDLFTSMVSARKLGQEQLLAQVLGGGMFLTTVGTATIVLCRPFWVQPTFFYRNIFTYILALLFIGFTYADGTIYLFEAVLFIILYAMYISFFFVGKKWISEQVDKLLEKVVMEEDRSLGVAYVRKASSNSYGHVRSATRGSPNTTSSQSLLTRITMSIPSLVTSSASAVSRKINVNSFRRRKPHGEMAAALEELAELGVDLPPPVIPRSHRVASMAGGANAVLEVERNHHLRAHGQEERANAAVHENGRLIGVEYEGEKVVWKKCKLLDDFLDHMNPIDIHDWRKANSCARFGIVVISPVAVIMKLLIPCIDETIICNNWCKLLFLIQCVYLPSFAAWAMGVGNQPFVTSIPVFVSLLAFGIVCSSLVSLTSVVDEAPSYHLVVAVYGFFISLLCIYLVANEVVAILSVAGHVLNIRMVTFAMTIVPWGNSIGDLINAVALAKAGFSKMAFTGIYGSSLLMILVGVGFSYIIMVTSKGTGISYTDNLEHSGFISNIYFFLITGCVSTLLIIPIGNYYTLKAYGTYLLTLYIMFFILCFLSEFSVINPLAQIV